MRALLLCVGLVASNAYAEPPRIESIGLHLGTAHFSGSGWENVNPGVYLRWNNGLTVGTLVNSEGGRSNYLAWSVDHAIRPRVYATLTAGVITGYRRGTSPLLSPSVAVAATSKTWVRFSFLPKASDGGSAGLHLSIERRF